MTAAVRALTVPAVSAMFSTVVLALLWLAARRQVRAHARWHVQHDHAGAVLPAYTPQTDDLYWSGIEAPGRWRR